MGLSKIANIPETASDQNTPPKRSNALLSKKMIKENRIAKTKPPAQQETNPRNLVCFSVRTFKMS